ncbi:MAG TPA: PTS transporter subunit EIIB [Bacilli bacterium]|nr:PTS transporter subunit EIIB [Bacilli bacterium]
MSFVIIKYLILAVVLIVIALVVMKAGKEDFSLEANKLVEYLGGKGNIINIEVNVSRFIVTLKDTSLVNKVAIQKLGAQGIVEIDNQLKIILKEDAKKLKKYIDEIDI